MTPTISSDDDISYMIRKARSQLQCRTSVIQVGRVTRRKCTAAHLLKTIKNLQNRTVNYPNKTVKNSVISYQTLTAIPDNNHCDDVMSRVNCNSISYDADDDTTQCDSITDQICLKNRRSIKPMNEQNRQLMEIAMKTCRLIKRNRCLQAKLLQLKIETAEFIHTVMANPENETFRKQYEYEAAIL